MSIATLVYSSSDFATTSLLQSTFRSCKYVCTLCHLCVSTLVGFFFSTEWRVNLIKSEELLNLLANTKRTKQQRDGPLAGCHQMGLCRITFMFKIKGNKNQNKLQLFFFCFVFFDEGRCVFSPPFSKCKTLLSLVKYQYTNLLVVCPEMFILLFFNIIRWEKWHPTCCLVNVKLISDIPHYEKTIKVWIFLIEIRTFPLLYIMQ